MHDLRLAVKRAWEWTAVRGGAARLSRSLRRRDAIIFAYHGVVPDGQPVRGERALHVPRGRFVQHMEQLVRTHDVVPLPALLNATGGGSRPRAAVTFDDAYRGAVTLAVEELVRLGLPATLFVAPGCLGDHVFWWDAFADPASGELDPGIRQRALEALAGSSDRVRAWAAEAGLREAAMPDCQRSASEAEVVAAARQPGITVGSHSWSHAALPRLTDGELADELERSRAWILERFPHAVAWIAYPYGICDARVAAAAEHVGYSAGLLIAGGWVSGPVPASPMTLPRTNIAAGVSRNGFVLRAAGVGG